MLSKFLQSLLTALGLVAIISFALQQFGFQIGVFATPAGPKPPVVAISPVLLEQVKHVNKQIFVEHYNAVDITYTEVPPSWGDVLEKMGIRQQFVLLLRGTVPAGFDLTTMTEDDIWVSADGTRAQVTLPAPKIFEENVSIDFEHTRILAEDDNCPDVFCKRDLVAIKDEMLSPGRERLIAAAAEQGILRQAAVRGKEYYESLFNRLGIADVRVVVEGYDL